MAHGWPEPHLTVVIGANGSGKTTWAQRSRAFLPKPFYNADSIAEGLGDPNDTDLQAQARRIVDQAIEEDLVEQRPFGFESTYSGRSRPNIVIRARQHGYTTRAIFIGTDHHDINIARVGKRVEEGGHDVPRDEIIRRWSASWANLIDTWDHFDRLTVMDNSGPGPKVILDRDGPNIRIADPFPSWAHAALTHVRPRTAPNHRNQ